MTSNTTTGNDLQFGFAGLDDVPRVAALIERAYRGPEAARGWTNEAALLTGPRSSPAEIEGLIRAPDSCFVTAADGDRLVGCALLQKTSEGAYFGMFAIDPGQQGSGLGKAMIAQCEATARELWGARSMHLTVISLRDKLIGWYERRGFARTGRREPFPFDSATGALRTDFDLIVLEKPL
ncbi:MAG: GNAT family N-acetyltransferase [Devosia sp.]|nr:GNAT family N-acetyltransferase [Devosia sp.]